jgi:hypothetical protein
MTVQGATFRPFKNGPDLSWFQRINWKWVLQRAPMIALAVLSSWGVGGFIMQSGKAPLPVAIIGGGAFDLAFLGVIALADQQLQKTWRSTILYFVLNVGAALVAALFNTLYYAGGTYAGITAEAITHGAPFAVFGLLFSLYYHEVMSQAIERELKTAHKCKVCGKGFGSENALNGHKQACKP